MLTPTHSVYYTTQVHSNVLTCSVGCYPLLLYKCPVSQILNLASSAVVCSVVVLSLVTVRDNMGDLINARKFAF